MPKGWKFNKTLNESESYESIKYERVWKNCTTLSCSPSLGNVICTSVSDLKYNKTWDDANTEISSQGDRQLVKWNLTHLGSTTGCFVTSCTELYPYTCTFAGTSIPDNRLLPGENITLIFKAYTTSNAGEGVNINNASAEGVNESGSIISVTDTSANVTVYYPYTQTKKIWEQTTEPGNLTNVSINLTNTGNATIKTINITDSLPACFEYKNNLTIEGIVIENKTWGYKGPVNATDSDGNDVTDKVNVSDDNRANTTLSAPGGSYAINGTFNTSIYNVTGINNVSVVCEVYSGLITTGPVVNISWFNKTSGQWQEVCSGTANLAIGGNDANFTCNDSNSNITDIIRSDFTTPKFKCNITNSTPLTVGIVFGFDFLGLWINYTPATVNNVTIQQSDTPFQQNITFSLEDDFLLKPNQSIILNFSVYTKSCAAEGQNENFANATGLDLDNNQTTVTIIPGTANITVYKADINVSKTVEPNATPTQNFVNYTIRVTNLATSNASARNITINDTLPLCFEYYDTISAIYYNESDVILNYSNESTSYSSSTQQNFTWFNFTNTSISDVVLAPGQYIEVKFRAYVHTCANEGYEHTNFANATGLDMDNGTLTNVTDANISVNVSCTPNMTNTSWSEWYNITTCNSSDQLIQQRNRTEYDQNNCNEISNTTYYENRTVECDFCTPNMTNTSWSEWYNITACNSSDQLIQQRNRTEYDQNNCNEIFNTTYYENRILSCTFPAPNINISKTPNATLLPPEGGNITYYYNVTNTGNVNLTNISVSDDKCAVVNCPKDNLAVNESMTCNCTTTLTQCGNVTNIAEVIAYDNQNNTVTANGNATVKVICNADITLNTTANATRINAGERVTYYYNITNTGNLKLTNIVVSDAQCSNVACPKSTLAANESMKCNCSTIINQTTINTVNVSAVLPDGNIINANDTEYVVVSNVTGSNTSSDSNITNSNVTYSNITNSNIENSTADNSNISGSGISDSSIHNSTVSNSTVNNSTIVNSLIPGGATIISSEINNNIVSNGTLIFASPYLCCNESSSGCGINNITVNNGKIYINGNILSSNVSVNINDLENICFLTCGTSCPTKFAKISIKKTSGVNNIVAGTSVIYYYNITNTGYISVSGINISDDKCSHVICPDTTLASGQNMLCNCTALIYRTTINIANVTAVISFDTTVFANASTLVNVVQTSSSEPYSSSYSSSSPQSSGGATPNQTANTTQNISQENISEGREKDGQKLSESAENVTNITKEKEECVNCGKYYPSWLKEGLIETDKKEQNGKGENETSPNGKSENISLSLQKGENATNISSRLSLPYSDKTNKTKHGQSDKGALWWLWLIPTVLLLLLLYLLLRKRNILLDPYVLKETDLNATIKFLRKKGYSKIYMNEDFILSQYGIKEHIIRRDLRKYLIDDKHTYNDAYIVSKAKREKINVATIADRKHIFEEKGISVEIICS